MESIGHNIVEMQAILKKIMDPPPEWFPQWKLEAEHVLHLAHEARDAKDYDKLRMLDAEAKRLVEQRKTWILVN